MHWDEMLQGKIYWVQALFLMARIDVCVKTDIYFFQNLKKSKKNYPRGLQKL